MKNNNHHYKHLTTYAVHSARIFLGEPVQPKGHHKA